MRCAVAVLRWGQGAQAPQILPRPPKFLDTVVLLLVELSGSIVISLSRCCLPNDEGQAPKYFFLEPPLAMCHVTSMQRRSHICNPQRRSLCIFKVPLSRLVTSNLPISAKLFSNTCIDVSMNLFIATRFVKGSLFSKTDFSVASVNFRGQ